MEIKEKIQKLINENNICLFMKGTPEAPQCGFSMAVSNVLKHLKVNFNSIDVLEDEKMRQGIKDFSDWPTIPQLYIKGNFIGGCERNVWKWWIKNTSREKKINLNFLDKAYIWVL